MVFPENQLFYRRTNFVTREQTHRIPGRHCSIGDDSRVPPVGGTKDSNTPTASERVGGFRQSVFFGHSVWWDMLISHLQFFYKSLLLAIRWLSTSYCAFFLWFRASQYSSFLPLYLRSSMLHVFHLQKLGLLASLGQRIIRHTSLGTHRGGLERRHLA